MKRVSLSFREVIPDQTNPAASHRKDITLNTGASQSTLQDIKVAERAGGFCYTDATSVHTRNRIIHWRTHHDCLEVIENSLDANLVDNHVRYRFADAPVLAVSMHEAPQQQQVVLLIVTVSSIHRLSYTHPELLARRAMSGDSAPLSVFHESSMQATRDPSTYHVIGHFGGGASSSAIPHTATAWLSASGQEAIFSLAYQNALLLFTMSTETGQTVVTELKQHTIVPRMFSNITGALRGKTNTNDSEYAVSLCFGLVGQQTFLYALYRDDHVRVWSVRSGQCVATINCVPDMSGGETRPQGPQQNTLRRFIAPDHSTTTLCVFLSHSLGAEFITIRTLVDPTADSSSSSGTQPRQQLHRIACIPAPAIDLVDFELDSQRLWALWCNAHGDYNVASYAMLPGTDAGMCWQQATLEPPADPPAICAPAQAPYTQDPKEMYCSHIFYPGRFQRDVIAKALLMFGRATVSGMVAGSAVAAAAAASTADVAQLSMAVLRDRVCTAIEMEIGAELAALREDVQLTDKDVVDLSARHWERFYACAEQYHVKLCQPIGLFVLGSVGGVCVVRKRTFSVLRPCELLEHLMMQAVEEEGGGGDDGFGEGEANVRGVREALGVSADRAADVVRLVRVLATLEAQLGDEVKRDVHDRLYQLHMPNVVVAELLNSSELEEKVFTRDFLLGVRQEVQAIGDLRNAINQLLETLQMDADEERTMHYNLSQTPRMLLALGPLFAGDLGVSILAGSLKQIALVRFALCRNLLILQQLVIDRFDVPCAVLEEVRSNCMPNTVVFVQAYYVMVWLCEIPVQAGYATATLDHNIQRLNVLQISAASRRIIRPQQPITLLEFFLRSRGLQAGWTAYVDANPKQRDADEAQWPQTLLPLVTVLGQLIWAVSGGFTFGEWLIGSCQHIIIQEYVRLLNSWCEWNSCSRHFIAAVTLLETGEPAKAFDLFMQSAKGVLTEPFLETCIVPQDAACSDNEAMTAYYLKIIQLFEQHGAFDHVIALAKTAIGILEPDDPQLAMFQSIVFANHLQLEHYDEAYHALIDNAEPARRKDCLRQLVVRLFDQQRLDLLMRFPYVRLQDELEEIVEARARAARIQANPYYDFLYAFHVTKGNMRRAAHIMYEQAMRLQTDGAELAHGTGDGALAALQSRYECLLACQNSLHLVDERYAWLAKPIVADETLSSAAEAAMMDHDHDDDCDNNDSFTGGAAARSLTQRVQVLECADIARELGLCEAQLTLLRHRHDLQSAVHVDAEQIVAVLANSGLYTAAVKLARGCGQRRLIAVVLEHLAGACVRADDDGHCGTADETWNWLKENDLADVPHRNVAAEMAWSLLQKLVDEHEDETDESGRAGNTAISDTTMPSNTVLHRAVSAKLIACGVFLPQWLQRSYQQRRPAELLMLYVTSGRLIDASALAIEYVWAMMSVGGEHFGLQNSLHSTKPAICLPVTALDLLLRGLEAQTSGGDAEYADCERELRDVVARYVETVERVSANRVEYRGQDAMRSAVSQRAF